MSLAPAPSGYLTFLQRTEAQNRDRALRLAALMAFHRAAAAPELDEGPEEACRADSFECRCEDCQDLRAELDEQRIRLDHYRRLVFGA